MEVVAAAVPERVARVAEPARLGPRRHAVQLPPRDPIPTREGVFFRAGVVFVGLGWVF